METTHVVFHGNCYDGFGAAWSAWKKLGGKASYIAANYGQDAPDFPSDARVVIADFSYDRETMISLRERVDSLQVLDHHKTAQAALEGLPWAKFDMEKSGAMLAWEYFHPNTEAPDLIHYLQDRDLWHFKLHKSKEVSAAVQARSFDFQVWDDMNNSGMDTLKREGEIILGFKTEMVKTMCKQARMMDLKGHMVPTVNASLFFSEVGHELCNQYPDADFGAYYFDRGDGIRQWGLRSIGDFDVSEVAKKHGGGGHKNAAGFQEPLLD